MKTRRGLPSKLSLFPFVCRVSTFSCLPCQTGTVCLFLSFYTSSSDSSSFLPLSPSLSVSVPFPYFTPSFLNPGRPHCRSLSQRKCRSSVFSDSLHTNTEEEMEAITSLSLHPTPHLLFFHTPPCHLE